MNGVKTFYEKYKGELTIGFILFIAWKLRGLFSGLFSAGDAIGAGFAGATAGIADAGKKAQQRVAIKTINPNATDHDLDVFEADATALAASLGRLPNVYSNWVYPDRARAFGIAKKYSRILMEGNAPLAQPGTHGKTLAERKRSLQLAVLGPFYYAVTEGRNLDSDLGGAMNLPPFGDTYKTLYNKYVK